MKKLTKELKKQIIEALKPLNPKKIIVFGSFAYGTPTDDSDLDICVVEDDYKNRWEEKRKIREALKKIDLSKDILNPTYEEFEFYKNEINSVYYDADKKGILLWQSS